ncbi:hypothetical protein BaRGS_00020835 [Batillaria attramentaria]|uniref:Uncharacterized protein n=1 Tax=Batillaria attramentaria TaxID=370345 RepID=A0ABD0KL94_9CAEN
MGGPDVGSNTLQDQASGVTTLLKEIKKRREGTSNLTNENLKEMTASVFDNLHKFINHAIDYVAPNSVIGHTQNPSTTEPEEPSCDFSSIRSELSEKDWENLKGGKRKITSDDWNVDSDVKPSASAVKVSVASGTGSAKPQVADVSAKPNPLAEAVKLLEVVRDELKGFFQWLKEKVVEKVGKLWQAVQTAFNTMLGWLRNIWSSIRTSSRVGATAATGSKVHLA